MKKILMTSLVYLLSASVSLEILAQCPGGSIKTATSATDLKNKLSTAQPGDIINVSSTTGLIDLGEICPNEFPLTIKNCVTLRGDFDLFSNSPYTLISFPYSYRSALNCTNQYEAFAFKMENGATIENICLKGPKTSYKDWRAGGIEYPKVNACNCTSTVAAPCAPPVLAIEGLSSGILARGKDCKVQNCEVFGFTVFAVELAPVSNNHLGDFTFKRNYIHNNKASGWGYGLWVSGGRALTPADTPFNALCANLVDSLDFKNECTADVNAYVENCVFFDNKHDVAGSGNRNSYHINQCTFSQRSALENIDRHNSSTDNTNVYVINPDYTNAYCPVFPPSQVLTNQYQHKIITDVGGNLSRVTNSYFYKDGYTINLTYPNINKITQRCTTFSYSTTGKIELNNNYFNDLGDIVTGKQFGYNGFIQIAHTNNFNDWPGIFSASGPHKDYINLDNNTFHPRIIADNAPFAEISSVYNSTLKQGNLSEQFITLPSSGSVNVDFDTRNSKDIGSVLGSTMRYLWRFHKMADETVERRSDYLNGTSKLTEPFSTSDIGITNINLMAINQNFIGTDLARQRITVAPHQPTAQGPYVLTFWIYDTFDGKRVNDLTTLSAGSNCLSTVCSSLVNDARCLNAGLNHCDDNALTGFELFAKLNNDIVWSQDIASNGAGWQKVTVNNLQNFPSFTANAYCTSNCSENTLEIGIRAVSDVDAIRVRGVTISIDDVYINAVRGPVSSTLEGKNLIKNGDFEESLSSSASSPFAWTVINENAASNQTAEPRCKKYYYGISCNGTSTEKTLSAIGSGLSSIEVRSGFKSYSGTIPSVPMQEGSVKYFGPAAGGNPYTYKGIKQKFKVNCVLEVSIASAKQRFVCPGEPITLIANITNPNPCAMQTVQWFKNGAGISGSNQMTLTINHPSGNGPFTPEIYTVRLINCLACGFGNASISSNEVIVNYVGNPLVSVTSSPNQFCVNQVSAILNATGAYTYQWSSSNGLNLATVPPITATAVSAGNYTYTVTGTDANGCSATATGNLVVNSAPTVAISGGAPFCQGSSATLDAGSGFSSYAWSTGATTQTINVTAAGAYTVTVTNSNGCSASDTKTITVYSLPTVSTSATLQTICNGQQTTITANASNVNYLWSNGATTNAITTTITSTTTFTVTVTNSNGCTNSASSTITYNNSSAPAKPTSITGFLAGVCNVTEPCTSSTVSGASSYQWTATGGATIASGQGNAIVQVNYPNGFVGGTISVVASNGTCQSLPREVGASGKPGLFTVTPINLCNGQSTAFTINPTTPATYYSNNITYNWTFPSGFSPTTINNGGTTVSATPGNSGNILVYASNPCGSRTPVIPVTVVSCKEEGIIHQEGDVNRLEVYPNPGSAKVNIYISSSKIDFIKIKISDAQNKIVLTKNMKVKPGNNISEFDISKLAAGLYFVNAEGKEFSRQTKLEVVR